MAQLGARFNGIEEVEGSNPSGSTQNRDQVTRNWVIGLFSNSLIT